MIAVRPEPAASIVVVESPDLLEPYIPAWESLAAAAIEPNVFQEWWMLLPAWRAFGRNLPLQAILVFAPDVSNSSPRLDALFLLERVTRFYGVPVSMLQTWTHPQSFLGTPLIRAGAAARSFDALLDWLAGDARGAGILQLFEYGTGGPFAEALGQCAARRGLRHFDLHTYSRALLPHGPDAATTLAQATSGGNRKELRRQRRRLEETGRVEVRVLDASADVAPWLDAFLALEHSGWKGQEGSALASEPARRRYFEAIARAAHSQGRLMMIGLFLDGRAIAMKCNFLAPPGAFSFKIAFDESLARFSPGVQLELENVVWLHERSALAWMDSCARDGHFMIERIWPGRRSIATTLVATGRSRGSSQLVAMLPAIARLYRKTRAIRRPFKRDES